MRPEEKLFENQNKEDNIYKPEIFLLKKKEDKKRFEKLLSSNPQIQLINKIDQQIEEYVKCKNPLLIHSGLDLQQEVKKHIGDTSINEYGVWVYYPWLSKAVHLLDEKEFIEVRTSRNLYKITKEERDLLATKKIGVIGLSVGQAIAYSICMERICGEIRLADFDHLDLSNLNRLSASLIDIGLNKCIVAARAISEIDPFIKVVVFSEGINKSNINSFLTGNGSIDILIEECDSIEIKVRSRLEAKLNKIPVLMDTNDSGIIDIERFDLEPERPILHGHLSITQIEGIISGIPREQQIKLFLNFFDFNKISERLKISFSEIGKSINSWPQLASSVSMGAGATVNVARRILLNSLQTSGRYYFDIENQIPDTQTEIIQTWNNHI